MKKKIIFGVVLVVAIGAAFLVSRIYYKADTLNNNALNYFVSETGDDSWSGTLSEPNDAKTDGPFKTVEKARDSIRILKNANGKINSNLTRAINVNIKSGTYNLASTLKFTAEDSGTADYQISYRGYGDSPAIISGGKKISTEWKTCAEGIDICYKIPSNSPVYYTDLSKDPNFNGKSFNNLVVNGAEADRARGPNKGDGYYTYMPTDLPTTEYPSAASPANRISFRYSNNNSNDIKLDPTTWTNLTDGEVFVPQRWKSYRFKIDHVADGKFFIQGDTYHEQTMPVGNAAGTSYGGFEWNGYGDGRYAVENIPEVLDNPGEWYLNKSNLILYYIPKTGENMTNAEVIAPVLKGEMMNMEASNLTFSHLQFSYADWDPTPAAAVSGNWGAAPFSALNFAEIDKSNPSGYKEVRNINFTNNVVSYIGNDGIFAKTINSTFNRNTINNIGGNGIFIGTWGQDTSYKSGGNKITNNNVSHTGEHFFWSKSISIYFSHDNDVSHNDVSYAPGPAINLAGLASGADDPDMINNKVSYNKIHNVFTDLNDGGAIYVGGKQKGAVIENNYIYNVKKTINQRDSFNITGIVMDDGHFVTIKNNVIDDVGAGIGLGLACENTVTNNMIINPINNAFFLDEAHCDSYTPPRKNNSISHNIIYSQSSPDTFRTFKYAATYIANQQSDYNLFYPESDEVKTASETNYHQSNLAGWKDKTPTIPDGSVKDSHSIVSDPLFTDLANKNYTLTSGSPALKTTANGGIGFINIDLSTVGVEPGSGDDHGSSGIKLDSSRNVFYTSEIQITGTKQKDEKITIDGVKDSIASNGATWAANFNLEVGEKKTAVIITTNFEGNSKETEVTLERRKMADLNNDQKVNILDFSILMLKWQSHDLNFDFVPDGVIDTKEFSAMMANWGK